MSGADITESAGSLTFVSGTDDTDDGVHLRTYGDLYDRTHLTPQGLVRSGDGAAYPIPGTPAFYVTAWLTFDVDRAFIDTLLPFTFEGETVLITDSTTLDPGIYEVHGGDIRTPPLDLWSGAFQGAIVVSGSKIIDSSLTVVSGVTVYMVQGTPSEFLNGLVCDTPSSTLSTLTGANSWSDVNLASHAGSYSLSAASPVTVGTATADTVICSAIPVGYRPAVATLFSAPCTTATGFDTAYFSVSTAGVVTVAFIPATTTTVTFNSTSTWRPV